MRRLQMLLAHGTIALSVLFIVLIVLNKFNSGMQFLSSPVTRWFLLIFCLCGAGLGIVSIVLYRRAQRARMARSRMQKLHG